MDSLMRKFRFVFRSGTHEQLVEQGEIYLRFVESRELAMGWKV